MPPTTKNKGRERPRHAGTGGGGLRSLRAKKRPQTKQAAYSLFGGGPRCAGTGGGGLRSPYMGSFKQGGLWEREAPAVTGRAAT